MMSYQWETVDCKALEEGAVYGVYINSLCGAPAAPGDRAVYPPVFVIHHKRTGPDGCAGSHRGPRTVKNWFFPRRVFPVARETALPKIHGSWRMSKPGPAGRPGNNGSMDVVTRNAVCSSRAKLQPGRTGASRTRAK